MPLSPEVPAISANHIAAASRRSSGHTKNLQDKHCLLPLYPLSSLSNSPAIVFHASLRPLNDQGRTSLIHHKSLFWPQNNGSCLFPSPPCSRLLYTLASRSAFGSMRVSPATIPHTYLSSALWPIAHLFVNCFCASVYPVMVHSNHESPRSSVIHNLMPVWLLWQPGDLVPFGAHPIPLRVRRTPGFQPKVPLKGSLQCWTFAPMCSHRNWPIPPQCYNSSILPLH